MRFLQNLSFAAAAFSGLSLAASANGGIPEAGSLLIFPTFENERGEDTLITITNTNGDHTPTVGTLEAGTVDVEYIYIDGHDCFEFNRTRRFTPNDTITISARADNPNDREGYVYAFAKSPTTGQAISWNWLIGVERTVEGGGDDEDFDVAPYVYKAIGAQGSNTDLNSDGNRQLDGVEYEAAADRLLFPRFTSQGDGNESELTLINLTGGGQFTAVIDFLIYNDNEEVFSLQYSFFCWEEVDLDDLSGLFDEDFLESTNHNPSEHANGNEYGWFRIDGSIAFSTADSVLDPVILALLAENIGPGDGGELPFGEGTQTNGEVLSFSLFHD